MRLLLPRTLESAGAGEAAVRIQALPPLNLAAAPDVMPALERIARATRAPPELIRPASQSVGALLLLGAPGREEQGTHQLLSAVARLAIASVRAGLAPADVIRTLAG